MADSDNSIQDILKRRQSKLFVGRHDQISTFKANIIALSENRRFVINITGPGGIGKSSLMRKFWDISSEYHAFSVWTDENETDIISVLGHFSDQLKDQGIELKRFSESHKIFLQKKAELEADPDKPKGITSFLTRTIVKSGAAAAKGTPLGSLVFNFVDEEALTNQVDEMANYLVRRFTNKDEVKLLLHPIEMLTLLFLEDVQHETTEHQLLFFFDTFEYTSSFLDSWIRDLLSGNYGKLPSNFLFVIAGRNELDPNLWLDYESLLLEMELLPFLAKESREYLNIKGIVNEQTVEEIRHLTGDLPLLVAILGSEKNRNLDAEDAADTAVERFLKWVNDPKQKSIILNAALPRVLNEDVIHAIAADDEPDSLFEWLRKQPFVEPQVNGWKYHDIIRSQLLRLKHKLSAKEWERLHTCLADFYRARIDQSVPRADLDQVASYSSLNQMEYIYHTMCSLNRTRWLDGIDMFLSALMVTGLDYADQIAKTFSQAGIDSNNDLLKEWGSKMHAGLNGRTVLERTQMIELLTVIEKSWTLSEQSQAIARAWRGYLYRWIENYDLAVSDLDKAIELLPDYYWAISQRGAIYALTKQYQKSLDDLERALILSPDDDLVIVLRGATYRFLGEYTKSLSDLNEVVWKYPKNNWALTHRAITHREMREYQKALDDLGEVLNQNPKYVWALAHRGITYREMGDMEKALVDFNRAIEIEPEFKRALANRGETYKQMKKFNTALDDFSTAIRLDANFSWAYVSRGETYRMMKRFKDAISDFDMALTIESRNQFAFASRGECYFQLRDFERARSDFQKALEIEQGYRWALVGLAKTYRQAKLYDKAVEEFNKAIDLDPINPWTLANRGETYRLLGEYEKAVADFTSAIELDPTYRWAIASRGITYRSLREFENAIADLDRALELDPEFKWARKQREFTLEDMKEVRRKKKKGKFG